MAEAHAPGKLVICGEYAVLHGAPAIAVAVDVRARASVAPLPDPGASRLTLPENGAWAFELGAGQPRWRERAGRWPGPDPRGGGGGARRATVRDGVRPRDRLDTRAFRTTRGDGKPDKLGLGSSAAITVALTAALLAQAGRTDLSRDGAVRALRGMRTAASRAAAAAASTWPPRCTAAW